FAQTERRNQFRAARPVDAAAIVQLDNRCERCNRTVVHIRPTASDVAQRRRLEGVLQFNRCRKQLSSTDIVTGRGADVMERGVGERPAAVTSSAMRLADEQIEPAFGRGIYGRVVAFDPAVEWRLARHNGALERRKG